MPSVTLSDIEPLAADFLAEALGVRRDAVVNARMPGGRPTGRYVSFQFIRAQNHSHPTVSYADGAGDTLDQTVSDAVYVTMRVTLHGIGSLNDLQQFAMDVRGNWSPADRFKARVGLGGVSDPQSIPEVVAGNIVDRSYCDMNFYVALGTERPVDWFDTCPMGVTFPEIPHTEEITEQGEDNG